MTGRLAIVGLGPGDARLLTPHASAVLEEATDLVGYAPYLARIPVRSAQLRHASDNRDELRRARHAAALASAGRQVAVISSGDAGVFGMASAVFQVLETGEPGWRKLDVEVVPGVSAMFAAAARIGAPIGHDFCAISLSDNLKPWTVVTQRLTTAASAGFTIALYNPRSRSRPWQFGAALDLLRPILPPATYIAFATAVTQPNEKIHITTLAAADPTLADMRTLVLIGTATTRQLSAGNRTWLYAPREDIRA
jgi:precorrin-3B C17-methyltransferase